MTVDDYRIEHHERNRWPVRLSFDDTVAVRWKRSRVPAGIVAGAATFKLGA